LLQPQASLRHLPLLPIGKTSTTTRLVITLIVKSRALIITRVGLRSENKILRVMNQIAMMTTSEMTLKISMPQASPSEVSQPRTLAAQATVMRTR
jgi:ABC-type nitrate/sulfonate/bicarbonate transport system permease component